MRMTRDVLLKMVALFSIACMIVAIVLAHRSPAAGYELSIYTSTPLPVLLLLFLGLTGGVGIVLEELLTSGYEDRRTCLIGFAVILLGVSAFLCLPIIRGYVAASNADLMGHLGFIKDILRTGHVGPFNPYPITHTFLAEVAGVAGLSAMQVANLNTVLVFTIFVLMSYLLASAILPTEGQRLTVAVVAGGTMAGISRFYLVPNTWSILMLPLVFYCYLRQERLPFKVLLAVALVAYSFFHPLSALVIMLALTIMELPKPIYRCLLRRLGMGVPSWMASKPNLWPIALEAVVFFPWVLTRPEYKANMHQFWYQLANFSGSHQLENAGTNLSKANVHGIGIAVLMVKMYGEVFILLILGALAAILLVKQLRSGDRDGGKYRLILVGVLTAFALLFFLANFVGLPGTASFAADRMVVYVEVGCIPLAGFALWEVARRTKFSRLAKAGASGLVILALVLNFCGHFDSPYLIQPNGQVTHADMAGMTWYLDEKDPVVLAFYALVPPERFSQAILGIELTEEARHDIRRYYSEVEDHFGYDNSTTLGEQYQGARYVTITRCDKVVYQTVWRHLGRFTDVDFERLEQDPTADRIYSNGDMDVLFIGA